MGAPPQEPSPLQTRRLDLRQPTADDAPALFSIFGDPGVTRYWSHPAFTEPAQAESLVTEILSLAAEGSLYQWVVALRASGEVVGTCTLARIDRMHRRAELGYALGRVHWGRGLASEAVAAVMRYAFERLDLHRLEADVDPRNAASLRLLERFGFRPEGLLRERYHVAGEIQDAAIHGLLRTEWTG